jgi:hypothetical protein
MRNTVHEVGYFDMAELQKWKWKDERNQSQIGVIRNRHEEMVDRIYENKRLLA